VTDVTELRADFSRREVVALEEEPWRPSPSPDVDQPSPPPQRPGCLIYVKVGHLAPAADVHSG